MTEYCKCVHRRHERHLLYLHGEGLVQALR